MTTIVTTDVYKGLVIETIKEMRWLATKGNFTAKQEINGVTVLVTASSDIDRIFRDQQRAQSGYITGDVGPYPKAVLSAEDLENDARVKAENDRKWQEQQAVYEAEARAKRDAVEARLKEAPEMEISDTKEWQEYQEKNAEPYGGAIISYSERWARLMQLEMSQGKKLEDIADATSREADLEGLTGFMYGCAVRTLANCWKHGDQLRRWHNLDIQVGDEGEKANERGGVLNPAMISVGA